MALEYSPDAKKALASGGTSAFEAIATAARRTAWAARRMALLSILVPRDGRTFRIHDFDPHAILQIDVARQSDEVLAFETVYHFIVIRVGNSELDFALLEDLFADPIFYDEDVAFAVFRGDRAAWHDKDIVALLGIDAHADVYVGQEFEFVIVHGTEQLANA